MTLKEALEKRNARIKNIKVFKNPHMIGFPDPLAKHWQCKLELDNQELVTFFSQGSAHKKPPTFIDVIACLLSDCRIYEDYKGDVRGFCDELGYTDYLTGQEVFKAIEEGSKKLKAFLGSEFDFFMYEVEPE